MFLTETLLWTIPLKNNVYSERVLAYFGPVKQESVIELKT